MNLIPYLPMLGEKERQVILDALRNTNPDIHEGNYVFVEISQIHTALLIWEIGKGNSISVDEIHALGKLERKLSKGPEEPYLQWGLLITAVIAQFFLFILLELTVNQ